MNSFSEVNLDMVKKKGLTIPCYVCYTFIHLGFHVFLNAHSELQSEMCQKENILVDKPFALPYSTALRNIQVVPVAEIGVEFRARTKKVIKSVPIQFFKYLEIILRSVSGGQQQEHIPGADVHHHRYQSSNSRLGYIYCK
jgi:hypothetical protein